MENRLNTSNQELTTPKKGLEYTLTNVGVLLLGFVLVPLLFIGLENSNSGIVGVFIVVIFLCAWSWRLVWTIKKLHDERVYRIMNILLISFVWLILLIKVVKTIIGIAPLAS